MTREEALAAGYKDETCSHCGTLFEAQIHFIRCDFKPCPMISTVEPRSLAQIMSDPTPPQSDAPSAAMGTEK